MLNSSNTHNKCNPRGAKRQLKIYPVWQANFLPDQVSLSTFLLPAELSYNRLNKTFANGSARDQNDRNKKNKDFSKNYVVSWLFNKVNDLKLCQGIASLKLSYLTCIFNSPTFHSILTKCIYPWQTSLKSFFCDIVELLDSLNLLETAKIDIGIEVDDLSIKIMSVKVQISTDVGIFSLFDFLTN